MEPVKSFTIKRSVWLRGERAQPSFLLRESDGKQCCIGIYLEACGIPRNDKVNKRSATSLADLGVQVPRWLVGPIGIDTAPSFAARVLMQINDETNVDLADREREVTAGFADVGITVTFEE